MANASIGGLVSGLDTATLIDQFMAIEAAPQTRLKKRVETEQSLVTTLQTLNTKAALLGSKAADLAKPATWNAVTATSSHASVTVSAAATAGATRLNLTVTTTAKTHQLAFGTAAQLTDQVTGASTKVRLDRYDGIPVELETGDGTLQGLVSAINDPANATGLRATPIRTDGGYRLLVESVATGATQDFDLTALDGSALLGGASVRAGADAVIDLGNGITSTSATGTFTDLVPGVTVTLGSDATVGTTSVIEVKRDAAKLKSAVTDLVAALNAVLTEVDTQTAFNPTSKTSGPLAGDATVRSLRSSLLTSVFTTDGSTLASVGIQTDRSGKVTFDAAKFTAAYAADPEGVAAMFTTATDPADNGFAARLEKVAKGASDPTTGSVTGSITGRRTGIERLQDSIENWDLRLELRRTTLQRQFTALETAMSQMTSQSSWLAGQLNALPKNS